MLAILYAGHFVCWPIWALTVTALYKHTHGQNKHNLVQLLYNAYRATVIQLQTSEMAGVRGQLKINHVGLMYQHTRESTYMQL